MRRSPLIGVVVLTAATLLGCSSSTDDVATAGGGSTIASTAAPAPTKPGATGGGKKPARVVSPACTAVSKYLFAIQSAGKAVRTNQEKTKAADDLKSTGAAVASAAPELGSAVLAINSALAVSLASTEPPAKGGTTAPPPEAWSRSLTELKTYNRETCAAEE